MWLSVNSNGMGKRVFLDGLLLELCILTVMGNMIIDTVPTHCDFIVLHHWVIRPPAP